MPPFIISLAAGLGLIFGLLGGAMLAIPKVKLPAPPPRPRLLTPAPDSAMEPKTFDDFSKVAAELDSWRRDLTERNNKELLLDAELSRREQVLQAERDALDKQRAQLDKVQKDLDDRLIKIKDNEIPRIQQLSDLYSTMKPDDAVDLLRALPQDQVTRILTVMKQKTQAKLLDGWIEKYPADKELVAQITSDLVRTINEPADAATASGDASASSAAPAPSDSSSAAPASPGADPTMTPAAPAADPGTAPAASTASTPTP